jgi:hypothetical protein
MRMIRVEFAPDTIASPFKGYGACAYLYKPEQWRGAMSEARYRRECGQLISVARVNENGECNDE